MSDYFYPDIGDSLTAQLVSNNVCQKTWEAVERESIKTAIGENCSLIKNGLCVDIGAGTGRLVADMSRLFEKVLAVEPDRKRFGQLEKTINESDLHLACLAICRPTRSLPKLGADLVLFMHVAQHIAPDDLLADLTHICINVLKPGGAALLTGPVAARSAYYFVRPTANGPCAYEIGLQEYVDLCNCPVGEVLPVRHFSGDQLQRICESAGFHVTESWRYRRFDFLFQSEAGNRSYSSAEDLMILLSSR